MWDQWQDDRVKKWRELCSSFTEEVWVFEVWQFLWDSCQNIYAVKAWITTKTEDLSGENQTKEVTMVWTCEKRCQIWSTDICRLNGNAYLKKPECLRK